MAEKHTPWWLDASIVVAAGIDGGRNQYLGKATQKTAQGLGRGIVRGSGWALRTGGRGLASATKTRAVAAGGRFTIAASAVAAQVAVGYTIGAVAGTAISGHLFGKSGARHALDFYTGQGDYGAYFDVVTNTSSLLNHYFSGN